MQCCGEKGSWIIQDFLSQYKTFGSYSGKWESTGRFLTDKNVIFFFFHKDSIAFGVLKRVRGKGKGQSRQLTQ